MIRALVSGAGVGTYRLQAVIFFLLYYQMTRRGFNAWPAAARVGKACALLTPAVQDARPGRL